MEAGSAGEFHRAPPIPATNQDSALAQKSDVALLTVVGGSVRWPEMTIAGGDSVRAMTPSSSRCCGTPRVRFLEANVRLEDVAADADAEHRELHARRWSAIAEMGWIGVGVPEEFGGAGLGLAAEAILHEEFGRALYPGAFLSGTALAAPGSADRRCRPRSAAWRRDHLCGRVG